jgi:hypothetical protein
MNTLYNSKHKQKYKNCVTALRREKVTTLIGGLNYNRMSSQQLLCIPGKFHVPCLWAKKAILLQSRIIRKCLIEICPEKETVLNTVSLSQATMT